MTPEEIPQELIDILDARAGKQHSLNGSVVRCLAEILTRYDEFKEQGSVDQAVTDYLRERLIDYIARLHIPRVRPVGGVIAISAESMADALLPFVREELANRPPTQDAYDAACAALWKHRVRAAELGHALTELLSIADERGGPPSWDAAWDRARATLATYEEAS